VHDIGLLSTFIGEDLVLPLVQRAWEAVPLHSGDGKTEGDE
jgi:hypothetical protein